MEVDEGLLVRLGELTAGRVRRARGAQGTRRGLQVDPPLSPSPHPGLPSMPGTLRVQGHKAALSRQHSEACTEHLLCAQNYLGTGQLTVGQGLPSGSFYSGG